MALCCNDAQVRTNSADPDQTTPREQSNQGLQVLQFLLHLSDAYFKVKPPGGNSKILDVCI